MNILISNDDGVYAPGLVTLSRTLSQIGNITVVAPDRNRSGASNSLTLESPLRIKRLENDFISVEGTPTDCVHLALTGLLKQAPDLIVSGINAGANLGDDVLYSGTVAAAMEGRFLGVPSIAVSLAGSSLQHYVSAAEVTKQLVLRLQTHKPPEKSILNVNVPDLPINEIKGFTITRLGTRHSNNPIVPSLDPRGNTIYWIGPQGCAQDGGLGTDFHAISQNQVSITPLQLDLTHYKVFDQLAGWIEGINISEVI